MELEALSRHSGFHIASGVVPILVKSPSFLRSSFPWASWSGEVLAAKEACRPATGRSAAASPQGSLAQMGGSEQAEGRTGQEPIRIPRRVDPWDGLAYTFEEITERYQRTMSPTALTRLWQQMAHARDHWLI